MKITTMYEACDGKLFRSEQECKQYETDLAANCLNPYIRLYGQMGERLRITDPYIYPVYAYLERRPTDEEFEQNPALETAWSDYLEADLDWVIVANHDTPGWYVRDPHAEEWHLWSELKTDYDKLVEYLGKAQRNEG
jgi:hypothetical protein